MKLKGNKDVVLTISPTILEKAQKYRGTSSMKKGGRKYSQGDYDSLNSLQRSELDNNKNNSNAKIQKKNLNLLLRPNSVLHTSSSPSSFLIQNGVSNE